MKKKGFTLIELLAVIVILAIIALIAVPVVINIINNAKKDAAKSSVLGYADAIEYSYVLSSSSGEWDNIEKDLDGCYNVEQLSNIVTVDGVMPSSDTKVCIDENSIVSYMEGSINNYNFKYENEKVIIEGEIIKTAGSIDAPTAKALVYNGEVQELINAGSSTTGEIQYKLEDGTYSKDIPTGTNVGIYKVYYRVIGDSTHYDIEEKSINVTINKANNVLSLSSSIGTVTYPDPITFEITNNKSNGTLSCESSDDDAATCSISDNTVTVTPGTKASNNVTITIKSEETDNYNKGQAVFVLVSQSGVLSYTANNYSGTYDGEEHTISVTSSGSTIKYGTTSGTYNLTSAPTYTNAGTYTVYYQITKTGYVTVTGSKTVTINKAAGSVTAPTAKTLTYNGSAQTLINAGSSTTGTIQYKLSGGNYSTSIPTATNAGTYTVYYRVVGNSNYNDVAERSLSVKIKPSGEFIHITLDINTTGNINVLSNNFNGITDAIVYIDGEQHTFAKSYLFTTMGKHSVDIYPIGWNSMENMFDGCKYITSVTFNNLNTHTNFTSLNSMFRGCSNLKYVNLDEFDKVTSNVNTMNSMFQNCSSIESIDLSKVNLSKVVDVTSTFEDCIELSKVEFGNTKTSQLNSIANFLNGSNKLCHFDFSNFTFGGSTNLNRFIDDCDNRDYILGDIDFILLMATGCVDSGGCGLGYYSSGCVSKCDLYYERKCVEQCPSYTSKVGNTCVRTSDWYKQFEP